MKKETVQNQLFISENQIYETFIPEYLKFSEKISEFFDFEKKTVQNQGKNERESNIRETFFYILYPKSVGFFRKKIRVMSRNPRKRRLEATDVAASLNSLSVVEQPESNDESEIDESETDIR